MDTANISTVQLHVQKDGVPLKEVSVTAFLKTKQTDENGDVTFSDVTGGKQTIVVKVADKTYTVPVYVLSPDIDVNLTQVQATTSMPADRQVAYQKAAGSAPLFIGMMVVFAVLVIVVLYFFNKKFAFLPTIVRWFLQMILVVVLLVAGIFITAYSNGSQDKLFAMISLDKSARASSDTVNPPVQVTAVGRKNAITVSWESEGGDGMSRAYLLRWGKNAAEVIQKTRLTNGKSTTFEKLDRNTEYRIEVQAIDLSSGNPKLSDPVLVTGKTQ